MGYPVLDAADTFDYIACIPPVQRGIQGSPFKEGTPTQLVRIAQLGLQFRITIPYIQGVGAVHIGVEEPQTGTLYAPAVTDLHRLSRRQLSGKRDAGGQVALTVAEAGFGRSTRPGIRGASRAGSTFRPELFGKLERERSIAPVHILAVIEYMRTRGVRHIACGSWIQNTQLIVAADIPQNAFSPHFQDGRFVPERVHIIHLKGCFLIQVIIEALFPQGDLAGFAGLEQIVSVSTGSPAVLRRGSQFLLGTFEGFPVVQRPVEAFHVHASLRLAGKAAYWIFVYVEHGRAQGIFKLSAEIVKPDAGADIAGRVDIVIHSELPAQSRIAHFAASGLLQEPVGLAGVVDSFAPLIAVRIKQVPSQARVQSEAVLPEVHIHPRVVITGTGR